MEEQQLPVPTILQALVQALQMAMHPQATFPVVVPNLTVLKLEASGTVDKL
jgi:hypothetical protein